MDDTYDGDWNLPVIDPVSAPTAELIRPSWHVTWTGDEVELGLEDALASLS